MRLKEDSSSYKAESVKRKEFRHSPVEESVKKRISKKDTRKWCKGIEGREHKWEMRRPKNETIWRVPFRRLNVCKNCGKQDYRSVEYWCEEHQVWDKHIPWWDKNHIHNLLKEEE